MNNAPQHIFPLCSFRLSSLNLMRGVLNFFPFNAYGFHTHPELFSSDDLASLIEINQPFLSFIECIK